MHVYRSKGRCCWLSHRLERLKRRPQDCPSPELSSSVKATTPPVASQKHEMQSSHAFLSFLYQFHFKHLLETVSCVSLFSPKYRHHGEMEQARIFHFSDAHSSKGCSSWQSGARHFIQVSKHMSGSTQVLELSPPASQYAHQ